MTQLNILRSESRLIAPAQVGGGLITPNDDDMKLINALSRVELTAEEVHIFRMAVSTDSLNAYWMRMSDSSLRNFVEDGAAGNPLVAGHESLLPIGKSFKAEYVEDEGRHKTIFTDYMIRGFQADGIDTDQVARGMQAGIINDVSIRYGGLGFWWKCSICGKDMLKVECEHIPGLTYDGEQAFAWIEDARAIEHSLVFDGADPGAMVLKAQGLAAAGRLSRQDIDFLESHWKVSLQKSTIIPETGENKEDDMTGRELLLKLGSFFSPNKQITDKLDAIRGEIPEDASVDLAIGRAEGAIKNDLASIGYVTQLQELGIDSLEKAKTLVDQAKDGEAYRSSLIEQTLEAGVKAESEKFDKELWESTLAASSTEQVKKHLGRFEEQAEKRLGSGGRQTTPPDPNGQQLKPKPGTPFDELSTGDQETYIEEFMARTGGSRTKKKE